MAKKQTHFRKRWLTDEPFRSWIAEDLDDKTITLCTFCRKNINLLSMGMSGLRHMKENTTHDDLAKERLKMSKKLAPIDELFKKDATLETQKKQIFDCGNSSTFN